MRSLEVNVNMTMALTFENPEHCGRVVMASGWESEVRYPVTGI